MENMGILASTCGKTSVRLRPSLIFNDYDCGIFLDKLELAVFRTNGDKGVYD
jgi:4-aminobutyrate aminotransferase-like enzyme